MQLVVCLSNNSYDACITIELVLKEGKGFQTYYSYKPFGQSRGVAYSRGRITASAKFDFINLITKEKAEVYNH